MRKSGQYACNWCQGRRSPRKVVKYGQLRRQAHRLIGVAHHLGCSAGGRAPAAPPPRPLPGATRDLRRNTGPRSAPSPAPWRRPAQRSAQRTGQDAKPWNFQIGKLPTIRLGHGRFQLRGAQSRGVQLAGGRSREGRGQVNAWHFSGWTTTAGVAAGERASTEEG